jgi:Na+-driven multidrug efflux pump
LKRLKTKWGIESNWQLFVILLVFSVTGYSSLFIAKPIMAVIGLTEEATNPWIYKPLRLILIFPFYQVLIVFYGWLFGQFEFFWNFEKKMLRRMKLGFLLKDN